MIICVFPRTSDECMTPSTDWSVALHQCWMHDSKYRQKCCHAQALNAWLQVPTEVLPCTSAECMTPSTDRSVALHQCWMHDSKYRQKCSIDVSNKAEFRYGHFSKPNLTLQASNILLTGFTFRYDPACIQYSAYYGHFSLWPDMHPIFCLLRWLLAMTRHASNILLTRVTSRYDPTCIQYSAY